MITEPRWKSYIVETTKPIFTPKQCQIIIEAGRAEPRNDASVGNTDKKIKEGVIDTETRTSHISIQKAVFIIGMLIVLLILHTNHQLEKYL